MPADISLSGGGGGGGGGGVVSTDFILWSQFVFVHLFFFCSSFFFFLVRGGGGGQGPQGPLLPACTCILRNVWGDSCHAVINIMAIELTIIIEDVTKSMGLFSVVHQTLLHVFCSYNFVPFIATLFIYFMKM